jgi:hypothetical protein
LSPDRLVGTQPSQLPRVIIRNVISISNTHAIGGEGSIYEFSYEVRVGSV